MPRAFRLIETLGEGSFGAVHLAEVVAGEGFVQRLAVKWLLPQWSHDGELVGRLRDEARLLGLLNHDHVVRVHGLTRIDGRLAILMEAVDGVDLSRLDGQLVPPKAALHIAGAVADALDAAWQTVPPGASEPLRVVHRDIKPSNIMVTGRGGVKVMDFGVARATFDAREAKTRSQQFGTARYMAPERWLEGVADAPSDVFSLGITLIELVGGRPVERPRLMEESFREDLGHALAAVPIDEIRALAAAMTSFRPADRPAAREVAVRCDALAAACDGASLKEWSPSFVGSRPARRGAADGSVVHEDTNETMAIGETQAYSVEALAKTTTVPLPAPTTPTEVAPVRAVDPDAPRWRQAMVVLAIVAVTVLGLSSWQAFRPRATLSTPVPPTPTAPVAIVAPVVDPPPTEIEPPPTVIEPPPVEVPDAPPPLAIVRPARPVEVAVVTPVEVPPPEVVFRGVVVQFHFDSALTVVLSPGGPVRPRRGVTLPEGAIVQVNATGPGVEPFQCTIKAEASRDLVKIDKATRTCH